MQRFTSTSGHIHVFVLILVVWDGCTCKPRIQTALTSRSPVRTLLRAECRSIFLQLLETAAEVRLGFCSKAKLGGLQSDRYTVDIVG